MTKFYRVENMKHEGPYSADTRRVLAGVENPQKCLVDFVRGAETPAQPAPYEDGLDGLPLCITHFVFGFKNMEALRKWFHPTLLYHLGQLGFGIVCRKVPDCAVYHGRHQSVVLKQVWCSKWENKPDSINRLADTIMEQEEVEKKIKEIKKETITYNL
jgi:hypothetical protein